MDTSTSKAKPWKKRSKEELEAQEKNVTALLKYKDSGELSSKKAKLSPKMKQLILISPSPVDETVISGSKEEIEETAGKTLINSLWLITIITKVTVGLYI